MNNTTNPLIGASARETIENAAEALSAAVVLLADKHSGLCRLLTPVLEALENTGSDRDAIENAAEAFSAAIVLMADSHSDLCRLLMPVLQGVEHVAGGETQDDGEALPMADDTDPMAAYNRRAAQVRAECEA